MSNASNKLRVHDDGLACPDVGSWAEDKYRLISMYQELFATGMKDKWHERVYIDLYAAAGYSKIRGTNVVLKGSAISALTVQYPFDKYIFCEQDSELMSALRTRCSRIAADANIKYVCGNCNEEIENLRAHIPKGSSTHKVLSLCFADPFDFSLKFETIRHLSTVYIDFLVLLATGMDANRNYDHYVTGGLKKIDEALGNTEWRSRWDKIPHRDEFQPFLAHEFSRSMESLGYLPQPEMKVVKTGNRPLYHLALFSRNTRAYDFWRDVLKYSTDQTKFEFEG